jgi:putative chitinase
MNITPALLMQAVRPLAVNATRWAAPLQSACDKYSINTPQRLAAFLAQIGHESRSLSASAESFDYSIPALMAEFPRTMPYAMAVKYGRQPNEKMVPLARQMQIANIVYGNRFGNGNSASGDGWKYRGSGPVQTTFLANFQDAKEGTGIDVVSNPDLVRTDAMTGAMVSAFFWINHGLNSLADSGSFDAITKRINPAMAGAADRNIRFDWCKAALGI